MQLLAFDRIESPGADRIPEPNQKQVQAHLDPRPDRRDFRAVDFRPFDAHLAHWEAQRLRQEQHFDVERPPLDVHQLEQLLGGRPREQLEAALGVFDAAHGKQPHQEMEAVHEDRAEDAATCDRLLLQMGARSDYDGRLLPVGGERLHFGVEFVEVAELRGAVGIGEQELLAACAQHALWR